MSLNYNALKVICYERVQIVAQNRLLIKKQNLLLLMKSISQVFFIYYIKVSKFIKKFNIELKSYKLYILTIYNLILK